MYLSTWGQLILWLKEAGMSFLCSWMGPFQGQMELLKEEGFRDLLGTFLLYCGNCHPQQCALPRTFWNVSLYTVEELLPVICHFLVMIITLSWLVSSPQCLKCFQMWHLWSSVPSASMLLHSHWAVCSFPPGMQWLLMCFCYVLLRCFPSLWKSYCSEAFFAQFFLMLIVNWKWTQP